MYPRVNPNGLLLSEETHGAISAFDDTFLYPIEPSTQIPNGHGSSENPYQTEVEALRDASYQLLPLAYDYSSDPNHSTTPTSFDTGYHRHPASFPGHNNSEQRHTEHSANMNGGHRVTAPRPARESTPSDQNRVPSSTRNEAIVGRTSSSRGRIGGEDALHGRFGDMQISEQPGGGRGAQFGVDEGSSSSFTPPGADQISTANGQTDGSFRYALRNGDSHQGPQHTAGRGRN